MPTRTPRTVLATTAAIVGLAMSLLLAHPAVAASTGSMRCYPNHLAVTGKGNGVSVKIWMKTGSGSWSEQTRTNPYPGQTLTWTRKSDRVGLTYWEVDSWGGSWSSGSAFCY